MGDRPSSVHRAAIVPFDNRPDVQLEADDLKTG